MKKWICKKFGHKFDEIAWVIFEIESSALNREDFKDSTISCQRCGAIFKHTLESLK